MSKTTDNIRPPAAATAGGGAGSASILSADDEAELARLSNVTSVADLRRCLSDEESRLFNFQRSVRQSKSQYEEKKRELEIIRKQLKVNKRLPYLVSTVAEILEMEQGSAEDEELFVGTKRKGKRHCGVIKTSGRQTIYLAHIGFVSYKDLKPQDLIGVNRDTYTVYEKLPEDFDSRVKAMEVDERPKDTFKDVGGLDKQINELLEAVVLPITNRKQYDEIGITPPKGVIMFGPPGTGKTMLARACAAATNACFLKLAGPQLVDMYIGEGSRMVRDAFALAKSKAPTIIFIDELDAIGKRRTDDGDSSREPMRTMLELLSQLDGFNSSEGVRVIAATNRVDVLDPALLRSGRIDRKVELPMPDEEARSRILEIHSRGMSLDNVNFEELARTTDDMNGAQLKAVCVEAGMLALRGTRLTICHEDFIEGVMEVQAKKKATLNYYA